MEFFVKIAIFLQHLTKKQFQQYFFMFLCSVCVVMGGMMYWIYIQSTNLLFEIKKIEALSQKSNKIIVDNERMQQEARRVQEIFDQNKDFTIKSFFETFCKEQGLNPEPGWSSRVEESNDRFDEVVLAATFKKQLTEKLVKILVALDKKDIVYIKDLTIRNEGDKRIAFDITIATKNMKKGFEQRGL
jgi:hypothetical protein